MLRRGPSGWERMNSSWAEEPPQPRPPAAQPPAPLPSSQLGPRRGAGAIRGSPRPRRPLTRLAPVRRGRLCGLILCWEGGRPSGPQVGQEKARPTWTRGREGAGTEHSARVSFPMASTMSGTRVRASERHPARDTQPGFGIRFHVGTRLAELWQRGHFRGHPEACGAAPGEEGIPGPGEAKSWGPQRWTGIYR